MLCVQYRKQCIDFLISNLRLESCGLITKSYIIQISFTEGFDANDEYITKNHTAAFLTYEFASIAPTYLNLCAISLTSIFTFAKAGFILKFFLMMITIAVEVTALWSSDLFRMYDAIIEIDELVEIKNDIFYSTTN